MYDPAADAQRKLAAVLDNARDALPQLADVTMPTEGTLTFCESLETAVTNADWIQESVPERLDIKHKVFAQVQAACAKRPLSVRRPLALSLHNCRKCPKAGPNYGGPPI